MAAPGAADGPVPVLDEFTAPAEKSRFLEKSRGRIQSLFGVRLAVLGAPGGWSPSGQIPGSGPATDRIWLRLSGDKETVRSAKEYIKGLCEPELEEKEHYPKDMHCIFVGAQSLFLNCLIQDTCADITVQEIGLLSIKGGAEAVVMARSHIQQFVTLFENNEGLLSDKESNIKKQFKQFVEAHADKYTMDLLILPSSLKRELLNLTQSDCCETDGNIIDLTADSESTPEFSQDKTPKLTVMSGDGKTIGEEARKKAGTPVTELTKQMDTVFSNAPGRCFVPINGVTPLEASFSKERQSCKRRCSDAEERLPKKQFSLESDQEVRPTPCSKDPDRGAVIDLISDSCSESDDPRFSITDCDEISEEMEYKILVNFFRTMGYSQKIVEKVISELGQSMEPLMLLEAIEKESTKLQKEKEQSAQISRTVSVHSGGNADLSPTLKDRGSISKNQLKPSHTLKETKNVKQKRSNSPRAQLRAEDKMHVTDYKNETALPSTKKSTEHCKQVHLNSSDQSHSSRTNDVETDGLIPSFNTAQELKKYGALKDVDFVARGSSDQEHASVQTETVVQQKSAGPSNTQNNQPVHVERLGHCNPSQFRLLHQPSFDIPKPTERPLPTSVFPSQLHAPNLERRTVGPYSHHTDASVTGVQRFMDSLKKPYNLELKNEPGRAYLKHIIIDGSNVAISHGLQKFFSCRGIAIAVDYFWKRGHRNITVFVPQWRTKRDPNIKEQHFLTQLQDVGILSLTPARMVLGARIAAHDDRFLLHLADKTGGIIVTNDNFREFVTESYSWREIIQKRDFPPAQITLPTGGLHSSGTSHFMPIPKSCSNNRQPMNQVHDSPPSARLPFEPNLPNVQTGLTIPPQRSTTETIQLREALIKIFPDSEQRQKIDRILAEHPFMRDLNALSAMVLD
ncbi:NEDD4-binding protein 1 isoform X2 [Chelonia mydas]|uniref:NEDD4-binding protein 1 isoform X2 n=1 Tax=Chelonia mydas TaxID=8469 RepID=UPI0018A1B93B|nr:NEDD4-binding protein 1 isoform X2 [Chelonia mydas]